LWATGFVLVGVLVYLLRAVLTPVFFAFLLAYMLNPVVVRFESWRIPRTAGIVLLLAGVLLAIAGFLVLALPGIVRDVAALGRELPAAAQRVIDIVAPWLLQFGIEIPNSASEVLQRFRGDLGVSPAGAMGTVGAAVKALLGGTASVFNAIAAAIMVPVFSFYLLQDFDRVIAGIRDLLPSRSRTAVIEIGREVDQVLGQFLRGQLTVMLILAVLYAAAYAIAGVRLAVPIGIIAGLLSFIPYVGGAAALGLALLMVALHWTGWQQLAGVVAAYALIQVLEGFVITPRIVGEKLGLAPIWVLLGLMVGGNLFGFMGVMLALPATAVAKVLVVRGLATYKGSSAYRGRRFGDEDETTPVDPLPQKDDTDETVDDGPPDRGPQQEPQPPQGSRE
jgi:predicted PurR-regulated permease PerM